MRSRLLTASLVLAVVSGCSGGGSSPALQSLPPQNSQQSVTTNATGTNVVSNPGFESGSLSPWTACGSVSGPKTSTVQAHTGTYSALIGTTSSPEVNGTKAVCQTVTVPASPATLSFWVYEGTNDTIKYASQTAELLSTSGSVLTTLYSEAKSTGGWVQKTFDISSYAGQTVQLYVGISGDGYSSDYVYTYLDDVSLTSTSATASPSPTPTPSAAPTATSSPTAKPSASPTASAKPTATPTVAPTASPTASALPFACNNAQFNADQSAFAAGTITADQPEDVCGLVTQVLAAKKTSSGNHGYFYVELPSGYQIEIVSNLDAMAEASTDKPPSTWPWVAVNQYVYVQGRYYYDSSSSQGIDWTEDDTSSSWSHLGYVAVCDDSGNNCQKYW